jgi:hypothetical protein
LNISSPTNRTEGGTRPADRKYVNLMLIITEEERKNVVGNITEGG